MPLTKKNGYSLEADMKFGWRPAVASKVPCIPLSFDQKDDMFELPHRVGRKTKPDIYKGWRPADSL